MSKGSNPRPVDATKYRENWERIFQPRAPEPLCHTCRGAGELECIIGYGDVLEHVMMPCQTCQQHSRKEET